MTPEQYRLLREAAESGDEVRAVTIALQIAAHNARNGRKEAGIAIRREVDKVHARAEYEKERKRVRLQLAALIIPHRTAAEAIREAESLIDLNDTMPVKAQQ